MNLAGTRIGPYELVSLVGAGGMGEVYRARDARLGRDVAIKVLPTSFATDPERLARFEREARLLASVNHPHIAAIYGFEQVGDLRAIVLELIDGETLADRLSTSRDGRIDVREALTIAAQIADALDAAHERGITHRDLKPANIKVTPDGTVKVLDFGLAKPTAAIEAGTLTHSSTMIGATSHGTLLGTAPYMSPEQARGRPVDKRADLWAFGCVLYEMLAGRRTFDGDTSTDAIAAILERQPDWSALPEHTPPSIRRLLQRCLEKDVRARQRDIGDARFVIDDALSDLGSTASSPGRQSKVSRRAIAALIIGLLIGGAGVWAFRPRVDRGPVDSQVRRLTIRTPSGSGWSEPDFLGALRGSRVIALSPDGTRLVYVGVGQRASRLYLRSLDQYDARSLDDTEGASAPFWSPDGKWIAFFASGKLRKIAITGGTAMTICSAADDIGGSSGAWGRDGTIVFALPVSARAGLMRVPSDGGTAEPLTTPDPREGGGHGDPSITADGRTVLFATRQTLGSIAPSIVARSLATGEQRKLVDGMSRPLITSSGHLVFGRGSTLFAVPLDMTALRIVGTPIPVQDGIVPGQLDLSADGLLAYIAEPSLEGRSLVWVGRTGAVTPAVSETRGFVRPRLSPDGRRVAVDISHDTGDPALRAQASSSDVWVYHFQNGAFTRLTSTGQSNSPFWSPDGKRVAFRTGSSILWQSADGSGPVESLIEPTDGALKTGGSVAPGAWSPDGRTLAFVVHTSVGNGADVWTLKTGAARTVAPVVQRRGDQWSARISPDGRWISYASNESGGWEINVEPIAGGPRHPVSTDGGEQAIWSPKGDELFYRVRDRMMVVAVDTAGPSFIAGPPRELFRGRYASTDLAAYDVSSDGQRFLMVRPSDDELRPAEVSIAENWLAELKRLSPVH